MPLKRRLVLTELEHMSSQKSTRVFLFFLVEMLKKIFQNSNHQANFSLVCIWCLHIMLGCGLNTDGFCDQNRGMEPRICTTDVIGIFCPSGTSLVTICSISTSLATLPASFIPRLKYLHEREKAMIVLVQKGIPRLAPEPVLVIIWLEENKKMWSIY